MATIQSTGIGSGLDVESIVTQLMAIERQPLDNLETEKAFVNAQISAYGSLSSQISNFQTAMANLASADKFQIFNVASSDESVITASADSAASAGTYELEVVQLAERDKIATKAYADSSTTAVGEGTLTITVGSSSFDVVIDSSNNTVSGIRDAINAAADNTGVTATVLNDDAGSRLIFSTDQTGTDNALKIEVADSSDANNTDDNGLSSLAYEAGVVVHRAEISTHLDAQIIVDDFTISSSTNTFSGALDGITFTAQSVGTSSLTVTRDDEAITESVQAFADAFNALQTEIDTQRSGQLEADSTLLTIERQMNSILNSGSTVTGSNQKYLVEVGLTVDKLGVMSVDSDTLTNVLNNDFESFSNFFSAEDEGMANRLNSFADSLLESDGLIDIREEGLKLEIDDIEDQSLRLELRLELVETRIRNQFTALDTLVSELSSTGDFLTQQLASLSNNNNS